MRHLWNHTAEIWRDTDTEDAYGSTHAPVRQNTPTRHNCRPDQRWSGDLQRSGGDRQSANRVWYIDASEDVAQGDVLKITAGPESPAQWRVLTAAKPTGMAGVVNHIEANCETFTPAVA